MPRHKKGTLVRVKPSALHAGYAYYIINNNYIRDHGYLWIVEKWSEAFRYYECKSLATGMTAVGWLASEITASMKEERSDGDKDQAL